MSSLGELAKRYFASEQIDKSDFRKKARILQSMWREEQGYERGEYRGKKRGNILPMPWAQETLSNYLSDTIKQVVQDEVIDNPDDGKLYGKPRIFNNLLSSQPLCFNLFAELKVDLQLASKVFNALSPDRIKKVTKIEFEYSPGRRDPKYTGDRSAFDVYVEFLNKSGQNGFVGIEVKYHEDLKKDDSKLRKRYFDVANEMGCFKKEAFKKFAKPSLKQIWRDHLLAGSLLNAIDDGFEDGFFVFLSPENNLHCKEAVEEYKQCLTDDRTFENWTLEEVAEAIKQNTQDKWIGDLIDRYLDFEKIESAI